MLEPEYSGIAVIREKILSNAAPIDNDNRNNRCG